MCKIWACKQHRHRYAFCAGRLFTSFCCFLLLLFLTMNPIIWLHITLFSTAALKTETVFCNNARVCVHCVCRGYQLCVCCAVPNEHIRPGVCQRLSVTNCRLVYSEWQQRACGRQTHTHTVSDMQTETMVVALPCSLVCYPGALKELGLMDHKAAEGNWRGDLLTSDCICYRQRYQESKVSHRAQT